MLRTAKESLKCLKINEIEVCLGKRKRISVKMQLLL